MEEDKLLIEKLEKLTGKKVTLIERSNVDKGTKKQFYLATSEFERALKRLKSFYEIQTRQHPDLKILNTKLKRLETSFNEMFTLTEVYLNEPDAAPDDQPKEQQTFFNNFK